MTIAVVLRLLEQALVAGRLAGEAERVETGERATIRDVDDLLAFLAADRGRRLGDDPTREGVEHEG